MKILKVHIDGKTLYLPHEQTTTGRERKLDPAEEEDEDYEISAACRWFMELPVRALN